jgi:putative tryptophan/tyrosine transport system substrate-binding protein
MAFAPSKRDSPLRKSCYLSRRGFVAGAAGLGLPAGCGRLPFLQSPPKPAHVGYLAVSGGPSVRSQAFHDGLLALGYVEDQSVSLQYRFADHLDRLPTLAAEPVRQPVDVVVVADTPSAVAVRQATGTIPIVAALGDLVGTGLVASLARPGGNVTGLSNISPQLAGKRLDLLRQTVPDMTRVAVLWNPMVASKVLEWTETERAAQALGVSLQSVEVRSSDELENAVAAAVRERAAAMLVFGDPVTAVHAAVITDLAAKARLPAMYENRDSMAAGGLMAYGPDIPAMYRRAAYYVDRILKGTKPTDLPVEQPMTFDFVVNLKTAREMGITFP